VAYLTPEQKVKLEVTLLVFGTRAKTMQSSCACSNSFPVPGEDTYGNSEGRSSAGTGNTQPPHDDEFGRDETDLLTEIAHGNSFPGEVLLSAIS
jgi:hypothetical protein